MKIWYALAVSIAPSLADAQSLAEFDLSQVELTGIGLSDELRVRHQVPNFASLRCPTCEEPGFHAISIRRMSIDEWLGGGARMPTQDQMLASCATELELHNEFVEMIEDCHVDVLALPAPLNGFQQIKAWKAGTVNDWPVFAIGVVIFNETGVVVISVEDDDQIRGLSNSDALTKTIAQSISAEFDRPQ